MRTLKYSWVVVGVGFLSLLLVQGAIYVFAVLLPPLEAEFGWSRTQTSSIFSIFLLTNALSLPVFGRLVDTYDPRVIFGSGAVLTGGGFIAFQFISELWHLYVLYVVIGIGGTAISIGTISPVVARRFQQHRGLAVGITTSGFSVGRLVLIPLVAAVLVVIEWRLTTALLGGVILLLVVPIGVFIKSHEDDTEHGSDPQGQHSESPTDADRNGGKSGMSLRAALTSKNFAFLLVGYMICGFTVMLFAAHFVAFAIDQGISATLAGTALGIEGGATIIGLLVIGALSDRIGRRVPLAGTYFVRAWLFIAFLLVERPIAIIGLAFLFGVVNLASIPLVTALSSELFEARISGTLYALLTSGHQLAGAVGVFVAGVLYDAVGTYRLVFFVSFGLLLVAAIVSLMLDEERPSEADRQTHKAPTKRESSVSE